MIKTIKEGQKVFTKICDRCGCEFSYELEDLNAADFVQCPCCHKLLTHIGIPATSYVVSCDSPLKYNDNLLSAK